MEPYAIYIIYYDENYILTACIKIPKKFKIFLIYAKK